MALPGCIEAPPPLSLLNDASPETSAKKLFASGAFPPSAGVCGMLSGEFLVGEDEGDALAALPKMLCGYLWGAEGF